MTLMNICTKFRIGMINVVVVIDRNLKRRKIMLLNVT